MNIRTQITLVFVLIFSALLTTGQNQKIDSIRSLPVDSNKVNAWLSLSRQYSNTNYAFAQAYADSALQIAIRIGFKRGEAGARVRLGKAAMNQSNYQLAEDNFKEALAYYQLEKLARKQAVVLNKDYLTRRWNTSIMR